MLLVTLILVLADGVIIESTSEGTEILHLEVGNAPKVRISITLVPI